jgi:hypothetical protein
LKTSNLRFPTGILLTLRYIFRCAIAVAYFISVSAPASPKAFVMPANGGPANADCGLVIRAIVRTPIGFAAALFPDTNRVSDLNRVVSGTLWINTVNGAFFVPFAGQSVKDPISFTLPNGSTPTAAFIDTLNEPAVTHCMILGPWAPNINRHVNPALLAKFASPARKQPTHAVPIDATNDDCGERSSAQRAVDFVNPFTPPKAVHQMIGGLVSVAVHLAEDSSIASIEVRQSANTILEAPTIDAAKNSLYTTQIENCRPVAATYIFSVMFAP